jgi:hypothetical protein
MRVLLLLAPLLASCSPALVIQRPHAQERCQIPVIVDGRQESCLSRRDLDELLRGGARP